METKDTASKKSNPWKVLTRVEIAEKLAQEAADEKARRRLKKKEVIANGSNSTIRPRRPTA